MNFVSFVNPTRMKKFLIIDDESDIRYLLNRALQAQQHSVEEAANLKDGLAANLLSSPDVIVLDVNLPDGNGADHACSFKQENNIVILISADNDQLVKQHKNYCASGFLIKPFTPDDLLGLVTKIEEAAIKS
jgi:DNA-binding response OmpR family regulator